MDDKKIQLIKKLAFDMADKLKKNELSEFNVEYDDLKITFEDGKMVTFTTDGKTQTLNTADIKRLFFSTEKTVTAIEGVEEGAAGEKVYEVFDLMGRKINIDPQTGELPKGVYIVNGKKILVK